ncbi:merozoite surface protein 9-like isoform X2 [Procambarus clarkii]|uniref:merozoite surface protein 9-like isoform X2 n=1 Tax=Procambarus clarkii TaxID=6728 RepID=UPI00374210D7
MSCPSQRFLERQRRDPTYRFVRRVMKKVINGMFEEFVDEQFDKIVLIELKQLWKEKYAAEANMNNSKSETNASTNCLQLEPIGAEFLTPVQVMPAEGATVPIITNENVLESRIMKYAMRLMNRLLDTDMIEDDKHEDTILNFEDIKELDGITENIDSSEDDSTSQEEEEEEEEEKKEEEEEEKKEEKKEEEEEKKEEEEEEEEEEEVERSICSDDDETEDEVPRMFDTDNIVFCQIKKIRRMKTRWTIFLENCIASVNGKEYFFKKGIANGRFLN